MARRNTRVSQGELNIIGSTTAHKFQSQTVTHLLKHNWRVVSVQSSDAWGTVVYMRHCNDEKVGACIYADGDFSRAVGATIKADAARALRAMEAIIPAPFLAKLIADGTL